MPVTPGASHDPDARLTPRPPGAPGERGADSLPGFVGGNLIGGAAGGLDEVRGIEPGEASLLDRDVQVVGERVRAQGADPAPGAHAPRADAGTLPPRSDRPE